MVLDHKYLAYHPRTCEQQSPDAEPVHMNPEPPPHCPSVVVAVGAIVAEVLVAEVTAEVEDVKRLPGELRYQFSLGSPRHSPTVTGL
jgi:hypothetical protein